ncbi:Prohibitin-1, subunit of the prohibitin complex (Phb1p-Phb2p) [Microbotryomycetes sp. JL201]|nr:Prohibitin-1, subunit of the prohibitin complex (Phb1p-Phb2p) [Microbotryomycetes sp. JL201]
MSSAPRLVETMSRLLVPGIIGVSLVQASLYDVPGGHRAIVFDRFSGRPILYDVRIKPRNISTTTGSKDMQMVSLTLRVMSRPDTRHLATIYRSLGLDYDERVLPSIGNEVLKATVAQFDAAELITQREVVSSRIREDLLKRASEFNIVLEDVSIVQAERAKFIVERSEQERQAAVVRAEGEAEAATIISRALNKAGEGLVQFRRIEASKDIAHTLSQGKNVTYLPGGGNVLLQVPSQQ